MIIDTTFDFTSDTHGYWDHFWKNKDGLGAGNADPDSASPSLREYHRILWSKELPNGEIMELLSGAPSDYLTWRDFRFGSDSILVSFRYYGYRHMLEKVSEAVEDYKSFVEDYLHKMYTIGGTIIFPKRMWGMNQSRGCNPLIRDRWDLTLECIRRYYANEDSPLHEVIQKDKSFFDLFIDFKGYVDFFFLQDCVTRDYSKVIFWEGDGSFRKNPLPQTVQDYLAWIDAELDFVRKRNDRIKEYSNRHF